LVTLSVTFFKAIGGADFKAGDIFDNLGDDNMDNMEPLDPSDLVRF